MRFSKRQARLETKVYESINDLEEEFNLDLPVYPEVIWFGRLGKFEDLALPEKYRASVESTQKTGGSVFLYRPNIIILNKDNPHHINEESSHCLHIGTTKLSISDKTEQDWFSLNVIIEMFGYLGSKILDPSRENIYKDYPDYLSIALNKGINIDQALDPLRDLDHESLSEFLIHSQGYGLAERMFYAFEDGSFSMGKIRKLVRKRFDGEGEATKTLLQLRDKLWPIEFS
jgi:hypothetical protein